MRELTPPPVRRELQFLVYDCLQQIGRRAPVSPEANGELRQVLWGALKDTFNPPLAKHPSLQALIAHMGYVTLDHSTSRRIAQQVASIAANQLGYDDLAHKLYQYADLSQSQISTPAVVARSDHRLVAKPDDHGRIFPTFSLGILLGLQSLLILVTLGIIGSLSTQLRSLDVRFSSDMRMTETTLVAKLAAMQGGLKQTQDDIAQVRAALDQQTQALVKLEERLAAALEAKQRRRAYSRDEAR